MVLQRRLRLPREGICARRTRYALERKCLLNIRLTSIHETCLHACRCNRPGPRIRHQTYTQDLPSHWNSIDQRPRVQRSINYINTQVDKAMCADLDPEKVSSSNTVRETVVSSPQMTEHECDDTSVDGPQVLRVRTGPMLLRQ